MTSEHPSNANCPLDWANGKLRGGEVLKETAQFYAYAFFGPERTLTYALVSCKWHYETPAHLPTGWGDDFSLCYGAVLRLLGRKPHNGYWNQGFIAGQRVLGHFHARIEPRQEDEPASTMGPGLVISRYNDAMAEIRHILASCKDPVTAELLRKLMHG